MRGAQGLEQMPNKAVVIFTGLAALLGIAAGTLIVKLNQPALVLSGLVGLIVFIGSIVWVEFGLYVLVLITYTRLSDIIIQFHGGPSVAKFFVVLMVFVILIRWAVFHERPTGWQTAAVLIGIYGLVGFSSLLYAYDTSLVVAALDNYFKDAIIAIVVVIIMQNGRYFYRVIWTLLAVAIFLGVVSVYQALTKTYLNNYWGFAQASFAQIVGDVNDYRIGGPIGDPNFFAQIMLVLVPISLERMFNEKNRLLKALAGLALGVSMLSVVYTFSRGGFLAMCVTLALMFWFHPPRYQTIPIIVIAAMVVMLFIPASFYNRIFSLEALFSASSSGFRSNEKSIQGRASETFTALAMFRDHPLLGIGLHNFTVHYQEYSRSFGLAPSATDRSAHDLYLEILAETGVLGLSTFLLMVGVGGRSIVKARKKLLKAGLDEYADMTLALGIGLIGYLIGAIFVHAAFPRYFYLLIGIAFATTKVAESEIENHHSKRTGI